MQIKLFSFAPPAKKQNPFPKHRICNLVTLDRADVPCRQRLLNRVVLWGPPFCGCVPLEDFAIQFTGRLDLSSRHMGPDSFFPASLISA